VTPSIRLGDVEVTRAVELELPTSPRWLLPEAAEPFALLDAARPWLEPFLNAEGRILQAIQAWVVRTPQHLLLIDTGAGNHKDRAAGNIPAFHMLDTPFLDRLAEAGARPEDVDYVLMTHMHVDHVGWNTRLEGGAWVPTFPNARYLFVRPEWEHWSRAAGAAGEGDATRTLVEDSLRPVLDAGLADLVPADHRISPHVWLEPSHGHTPGHVCVRVSGGAGPEAPQAVFSGDLLHAPLQCAAPDERPALDRDAAAGRAARRAFLERYAGTRTLVLGAHFGGPGAGYVERDGATEPARYRLDALR
jgi:glyoxylase-like metal-dependent hydrolase (beta-lactamase superfamily II)